MAIRRLFGGRRHDVNMTEGSILGHLLRFAFPMLIGNVFQQLYNMVDTWVVGNYVSNEAFSAVGSVGPIINTLIGLFFGFSGGTSAVIAQYYGAKKPEKVQQAVHTALLTTMILGAVFSVVGLLITPAMLTFMKTPVDVIPESQAYLNIYFAGIIGLMFYNIGSGILRAVGDSTKPFIFLVISAVVNIVLDLVFVLVFGMGVRGVALATVLAQGLSALLILITLMRSHSCVRVSVGSLRIHASELKKILRVGIPAALQMAVTSFSNVFVQSYINYFGPDGMSGWTAYAKIDQLILLPMQSLALASTTFVGQNLGAGRVKRARQGVNTALCLSMASTVVLMLPVMIFAPHLVAFFNGEAEVIRYGVMFLRYISPFYVLCCINQVYAGALRGAGNTRAPMLIMLSSFVLFRQVYLFIMANFICNEPIPIGMSYPAGWLLCSVLTAIYFHKVNLTKSRLVDSDGADEEPLETAEA